MEGRARNVRTFGCRSVGEKVEVGWICSGMGTVSHCKNKAGGCRWIGFLHMSVGDFFLV